MEHSFSEVYFEANCSVSRAKSNVPMVVGGYVIL